VTGRGLLAPRTTTSSRIAAAQVLCPQQRRTVMVQSEHRSFCLTPPPNTHGMRVKPHLRVLFRIYWACNLGVVFLSFVGVIQFLAAPLGAPILNSVWGGCLLFFGIPYIAARLVHLAFKMAYRRFGLMTPEEARAFPYRGRYPDAWLEPAEGRNERRTCSD